MAAPDTVAARPGTARRLLALDAFRGFTVASMIFVSSMHTADLPGQLRHAAWHGVTFRDVIAPFFLFAMGMAMAFSLARHLDGRDPGSPWGRILRRGAILVAAGLVLNFVLYEIPDTDLSTFRIMGVLQRIGLAYVGGAVIVLLLSTRAQVAVGLALLVGYGVLLAVAPVPGYGAGVLTPEGNLAGYVDRLVLTDAHLHRGGPFDPEGLLATLPSIVTVLTGWWTGRWLRARGGGAGLAGALALVGAAGVLGGFALGLLQPVNKALWTPAFVLVTSGWAWVTLAVLVVLVDVAGLRRFGWTFEVFGRNALFAFTVPRAVAHLLDQVPVGADGTGAFTWAYVTLVRAPLEPAVGPATAAITFGLAVTALWWIVHLLMYRRGWFIRV
jgi:predicted acyltransferase